MTDKGTSGQSVQKSPKLPEGLFLMDGIEGLRSLPRHSVDMLLTAHLTASHSSGSGRGTSQKFRVVP